MVSNVQDDDNNTTTAKTFTDDELYQVCLYDTEKLTNKSCKLICQIDETTAPDCVVGSVTFWTFVLCLCFGTIGFNVTNSATDATCFDILGMDSLPST